MDLAKICSGCYADFDSDLSIKTGRTCRVSIPESRLVSKQKQGVHGPPNCNRQQQTVQEACILAKLTCTCCICDANSPPARCTSLPGLFFLLRNVSKNTTLDQGMMADDSLDDQERDFVGARQILHLLHLNCGCKALRFLCCFTFALRSENYSPK